MSRNYRKTYDNYTKSRFNSPKKDSKPTYSNLVRKKYKAAFDKLLKSTKELLPPMIELDMSGPKLPFEDTDQGELYNNYARFVHNGQRKLFLAEIEHLTSIGNHDILVVYIGAAPTNKAWYVCEYFPRAKFVMIDPNGFNIFMEAEKSHYFKDEPVGNQNKVVYLQYSSNNPNIAGRPPKYTGIRYFNGKEVINVKDKYANYSSRLESDEDAHINRILTSDERIYIIEDYFTTDLAHFIKKLFDKRGDYRSVIWSDMRSDNNSTNIMLDTARVYSWTQLAPPDYAMFKFRCPFETNIDYDEYKKDFDEAKDLGLDLYNIDEYMPFYDGIIKLQCWPGDLSAETRIHVTGDTIRNRIIKDYNRMDYEQTLFYYNVMIRKFLPHQNDNADPSIGFDHCNDCAKENYLFSMYKEIINPDINVKEEVVKLSEITERNLTRRGHGRV